MLTHIRHILLTLILIPAFVLSANAQESSLLWKIEGNGLSEPSWLYGTMHLMCGEDFAISDHVVSYLESSDALALEIDLSDSEVQQQMMHLMRLPEGKNISSYIPEDKREDIDRFFTSNFGSGLDMLGEMKPLTLTSMSITAIVQCEQAFQSYDMYLMQKASEHGLEITALETVEFQFGLFDEIPLEDQVFELVKMIMDPESGRQEFQEMTRLYLSEDIEGMYQLIIDDEFWDAYRELLLYERNRAWIPQIAELSAEKTVLYAVGAGHLAGEYGVINLLRNEGFTVTAVE